MAVDEGVVEFVSNSVNAELLGLVKPVVWEQQLANIRKIGREERISPIETTRVQKTALRLVQHLVKSDDSTTFLIK